MSTVANPSQALHKPIQAKSKYRPEIDGLRAFAVVAVIINHFNKDLLPSGYLGVDIFFVISGYVITSSLSGRESKNFWDFVTGFYERRIKRLVPALVVFAIAVNILSWFFISPQGIGRIATTRTSLASLVGLSNLYIYKQATDYFSATAELNPFLHTWSLGVEEQFYLLFPFLIWFSGFGQQTAKGARNLFFWVGALTVVSLIGFIHLYQVNQPAAYFLMPPRFWEMAAGCLIFIGFQKRESVEQALEQVPPLLVVTAMVGVMFLPVSAAVPATIGIVLLSAILIACLKQGTTAYRVFTLEKVVFIGLISYSLYLWHWAVLSLSLWTIGIHPWTAPLQVLAMLIAAVISYKWVEKPFRQLKYQRGRGSIFLAAFCSIPVTAAFLFLGDRFAQDQYKVESAANKSIEYAKVFCKFKSVEIVLIGDSHAGQYASNGVNGCPQLGTRVRPVTTGGTIFPLINYTNSTSGRTPSKNKTSNLEIASTLRKSPLPSKEKGFVAISIRPSLYFYDPIGAYKYDDAKHFNPGNGESISKRTAMDIWFQKLNAFIAQNPKVSFVLLSPNPEFDQLYPEEVCTKEWFRPILSSKCEESRNRAQETLRHAQFNSELQRIADKHSNALFFDVFSVLCPQEQKSCSTRVNGKRLYSDDNHLNAAGARYILERLSKFLENH